MLYQLFDLTLHPRQNLFSLLPENRDFLSQLLVEFEQCPLHFLKLTHVNMNEHREQMKTAATKLKSKLLKEALQSYSADQKTLKNFRLWEEWILQFNDPETWNALETKLDALKPHQLSTIKSEWERHAAFASYSTPALSYMATIILPSLHRFVCTACNELYDRRKKVTKHFYSSYSRYLENLRLVLSTQQNLFINAVIARLHSFNSSIFLPVLMPACKTFEVINSEMALADRIKLPLRYDEWQSKDILELMDFIAKRGDAKARARLTHIEYLQTNPTYLLEFSKKKCQVIPRVLSQRLNSLKPWQVWKRQEWKTLQALVSKHQVLFLSGRMLMNVEEAAFTDPQKIGVFLESQIEYQQSLTAALTEYQPRKQTWSERIFFRGRHRAHVLFYQTISWQQMELLKKEISALEAKKKLSTSNDPVHHRVQAIQSNPFFSTLEREWRAKLLDLSTTLSKQMNAPQQYQQQAQYIEAGLEKIAAGKLLATQEFTLLVLIYDNHKNHSSDGNFSILEERYQDCAQKLMRHLMRTLDSLDPNSTSMELAEQQSTFIWRFGHETEQKQLEFAMRKLVQRSKALSQSCRDPTTLAESLSFYERFWKQCGNLPIQQMGERLKQQRATGYPKLWQTQCHQEIEQYKGSDHDLNRRTY